MNSLNIIDRLKTPVPVFFKKLQLIVLLIGFIITTVGGVLKTFYPDDEITLIIIAVGVTFGTIGGLITQATTDWKKLEEQTKELDKGTPLN